MAVKLSYIVPVYNVQMYLGKCIDSLLHQGLQEQEYEIILIDDGSADASGSICDDFASKFDQIRVLHQHNQGLSAARNAGINVATGKYVQFVDSDDYLQPFVVGSLLDKAEKEDLDVLRFNYQIVNEVGKTHHPYKEEKVDADFGDMVVSGEVFLENKLGTSCYACQFIVRANLIRENSLYFTPGIYFEDTVWTPEMLRSAHSVNSIDIIVYNYMQRSQSITKDRSKEHVSRILSSQLYVIDYLKRSSLAWNGNWYRIMMASICVSFLNSVAFGNKKERKDYLHKLKDLSVLPLYCDMPTKTGRRKMRIINLSPSMYCAILKMIHK